MNTFVPRVKKSSKSISMPINFNCKIFNTSLKTENAFISTNTIFDYVSFRD